MDKRPENKKILFFYDRTSLFKIIIKKIAFEKVKKAVQEVFKLGSDLGSYFLFHKEFKIRFFLRNEF